MGPRHLLGGVVRIPHRRHLPAVRQRLQFIVSAAERRRGARGVPLGTGTHRRLPPGRPGERVSTITMAAAAAANGDTEGDTSTAVALRPPHTALLFGTVSGAIGMVVAVDRAHFAMLSRLEAALRGTAVSLSVPGSDDRAPERIVGIGGLQHAEWRAPLTDRTAGGTAWGLEAAAAAATAGQRGIIDGDLVERYLDLHPSEMQEVARQMGTSADQLTAVVEEMARLHS
eukprot:ctg_714.g304